MGEVAVLNRTLEQELFALLRGASLECLVCGEFVLHKANRTIGCPECGAELRGEAAAEGASTIAEIEVTAG
jgi:Zn finger protein HypA/HybF involved in hydrogenase expression